MEVEKIIFAILFVLLIISNISSYYLLTVLLKMKWHTKTKPYNLLRVAKYVFNYNKYVLIALSWLIVVYASLFT